MTTSTEARAAFGLEHDGGSLRLPVHPSTEGPSGLDVSGLLARTGHVTLDAGYGNTAACSHKIEADQRQPRIVQTVVGARGWAGGHLDGAAHLPLHELPSRMAEVPAGQVWVHCAAGYRAALAASLLAAAGRDVVLIDDQYDNRAAAGLPEARAA